MEAAAAACALSAIGENKTVRISNIPLSISSTALHRYLEDLDNPLGTIAEDGAGNPYISLAPDASGENIQRFQVATVTFSRLDHVPSSSLVHLGPLGTAFKGTVDTHFRGLTPLNNPKDATVDIIAVTGLAGHAFGSWRSRGRSEMWLRDFLPSDMEDNGHRARILTYGYDTELKGSHSSAGINHFAIQFMEAVEAARSRDSSRPLILIGHSLGGLVIKEAIIESFGDRDRESILRGCDGVLFFSVPHKGLADARLVCMVHGQPNQNLVRDLCGNSQFLRTLDRSFGHQVNPKGMGSRIISFYETKDTMTVKEVNPGVWKRCGPYVRMVTEESVRHAAENGQYFPIDADHSSIVKFTSHSDPGYQIIRRKLLDIAGSMALAEPKAPCEERIKICKWLYPGVVDEKHIDISGKRRENTGGWLLADNTFTSWKDNSGPRILWGCGISGAGKTFLCSLVVDVLGNRSRATRNTGLAYIYFDYQDQSQQLPVTILRSLIKQLISMPQALTAPIPQSVQSLYNSNVAAGSTPHLKDLQDALLASLKLFAEIFFVFDALDECQEGIRKDLLPLIHWIAGSGSRIFLTSRPYPEDIAISLNPSEPNRNVQRLDLAAKEEDVIIYIEETIQEHIKARRLITGDLRTAVVSKLVDACRGMFLLVHFYIEDLCQYPTAREIRHALGSISSTLGTESALDGTYRRAVDSIRAQHKGRVALALKALAWLLTAHRPLSVDELRMALAMDEEGCGQLHGDIRNYGFLHSLLNDVMPDEASILDACRGLVIVDHNSHTIRLAHYSVHEYLEGTSAIGGLAKLHLTVALGCLAFVQFSFTEKKLRSSEAFECQQGGTSRTQDRLFEYIWGNLHKHMQACHQIAPTETLLRFLRDRNLLQYLSVIKPIYLSASPKISNKVYTYALHAATAWGSIRLVNGLLEPQQDGVNLRRQIPKGSNPLHVAAAENLVEMVRFWLDDGVDPEAKGHWGETALGCAIETSSIDAARLLLSRVADPGRAMTGSLGEMTTNVDMLELLFEFGLDVEYEFRGRTMLQNAACTGDHSLVKFLLGKGANVNALDTNQRTPLHLAVGRSDTGVVKLLLESGAEVNVWDKNQKTPLHLAARDGEKGMMQMLLESGAEVNVWDTNQKTPLHLAAGRSNTGVVKLLLQSGAEVNVWDTNQRTPLHLAASNRDTGVVKLLLESGAEMNALDTNQQTPLHLALGRMDKGVVKMLLESGAYVDARDSNQKTPLHLAASNRDTGVVKLLLELGAEMNALDTNQQTPLHLAVDCRDKGVVKMLLESGAEVNVWDSNQKTPLHLAASNRDTGVVKLLLKSGAEVNVWDTNQNTPLHLAAGWKQKTPLHLAAGWRDTGVVKLLLESGAEVNALDTNQQTPLHLAVGSGDTGMVQLLLESGAYVDVRDNCQTTPLHLAARAGDRCMVRLLLDSGADNNSRDTNQMSAMHHAAGGGKEYESFSSFLDRWTDIMNTLALLSDAGADTNARDGNRRTPLHYAVMSSNRYVAMAKVEYLVERGAVVHARDIHGNTPLQYLLVETLNCDEYEDVVQTLISVGANVNTINNDQTSPLSLATQSGSKRVLALLLDAGADKDSNHQTLVDVAMNSQRSSADIKPSIDRCIGYRSINHVPTADPGAEGRQPDEEPRPGNERGDQCPREEPSRKRRYSVAFPTKTTD